MEKGFQKPSNWLPFEGKWDFEEDSATYHGPSLENQPNPRGTALCDIKLRSGSIKVEVRFAGLLKESTAGILFGYDAGSGEYYYAGIGGYGYNLSDYSPNRGWRRLGGAVSRQNVEADRGYQIEVRVNGTRVRLFVDKIKVVEHDLPRPLRGDQTGLFAWDSGSIEYRSTAVNPTRPKLFVIMDFGEPYDALYSDVIKPVADRMGLKAYRADDVSKPGIVMQDVVQGIVESEFIVAELTSLNPNVFYELGYAHALDKLTILQAENGTELPFDIQSYRCIYYDDSIRGKKDVEEKLLKHLESILQDE